MDENTKNPDRPQGDRPEGCDKPSDGGPDDDEDATAFWGDPIYVYTRRQALEDGVLIDVTALAKEAGFKWPFAMTAEVWAMIETIPETHSHEDPTGRLWDVLRVAFATVRTRKKDVSLLEYTVILHHAEGDRVRLKLVSGPGDEGEPVLTLMFPWQD